MASYKLNMARIRGCPPPKDILARLEKFGLPETEEFGVLNCSASDQAVFATLIRKSSQAIQRLDATTKELTAAPVERVTAYPLAIAPRQERLELYAGSAAGIEQAGAFFSGCLGLPAVTEAIEMDIPAAVEKLAKSTQKFQLRSVRVADFAHNSFMAGTYAPKFLDSQHGMDFLGEYAESIQAAGVRFAAPGGRVNVSIARTACFTYSCNEEDQTAVQIILRKLI